MILVLEKDWVCILNIECCLYVRVMRIPIWFNESLPSHQNIIFVPNAEDEYEFVTLWGSKSNKIAKFRIDKALIEHLNDFKPQK